MKYGFSIPHRGPMANRADIMTIARHGEAQGYAYCSVPDHILVPRNIGSLYPYSDTGEFPGTATGESMEQIAVMAFLAGITERLRILASVMVIPHRHPLQAAKALATIDQLTNGRVTLGCGAGWMVEEFVMIGAEPFEERGRITDEYIRVMKEVWSNDDPAYHGDYVDFADVYFRPQPAQRPHPPIWIGGESAPALRRAVALGDSWYPIATNPQFPLTTLSRYRKRIARLHELAEEAGRDPATIELNYAAAWNVGASETMEDGERRLFAGSVDEIAEDVAAMAEIGVKHLFLSHHARSKAETGTANTAAEYCDRLTYWMEEVASKVKG